MADTIYQQLRGHLHHLRLTAVADRLAPALEAAEQQRPAYTQFLADLLAHEVDAVEQRRLQGRLRFAKLRARKTLDQFDFSVRWTAASSRTSRRCASSKTRPMCCSSACPASARECSPRSSATR
jgi:hypothetical protein